MRQHGSQELVPFLARRAIFFHRFLVRFDQRLMDVGQDVADHAVAARIHLRHGFDRFDPTGRIRRHFNRRLVVLFDSRNGIAQGAMQCRISREVFSHGVVYPVELPFDNPFLGFASVGQQYFTIANRKPLLATTDRSRRHPQPVVQQLAQPVDRGMSRRARQVQHRY